MQTNAFLNVELKNGKRIESLCSLNTCMLGGLARHKANSQTSVICAGNVSEVDNSIMIKSKECNDQIGPYHSIDHNSDKIIYFIKFVYPKSNISNNFNLLKDLDNWINQALQTQNSISRIKKFDKFLGLFMNCKNIIEDEYVKRKHHMQTCVCISNQGHTQRFRLVEGLVESLNDVLKICITPVYNKNLNIKFTSLELCKYFIECKYNSAKIRPEYIDSLVTEFTKTNFKYVNFDSQGIFNFYVFNYDYQDLKQLEPYHPDIETKVKNIFRNKLENVVVNVITIPENYIRFTNPFLSCIEVDNTTNDVINVGVNYSDFLKFLEINYKLKIDQKFLETFIETKYKSNLYKSCFIGLLQHHYSIMVEICRIFNHLNLDDDIKLFLKYLCGLIPSLSTGKIVIQSDLFSTILAIKSYPFVDKAYSSYIQSNPPPKGSHTTKDFILDLKTIKDPSISKSKKIPLTYIIDFLIFYENQYNTYVESLESQDILAPTSLKSYKKHKKYK
jgi:hypothetical protein